MLGYYATSINGRGGAGYSCNHGILARVKHALENIDEFFLKNPVWNGSATEELPISAYGFMPSVKRKKN